MQMGAGVEFGGFLISCLFIILGFRWEWMPNLLRAGYVLVGELWV